MTQPYVGEIQLFGFNFNPPDWAFCNGAAIPIAQASALFSLIGVDYGGNGTTYFNLPNLAGRAACGQGYGPGLAPRTLGQFFGTDTVTLSPEHMPAHTHALNAWSNPDPAKRVAAPTPGGALAFLDSATAAKSFRTAVPDTALHPAMVGSNGQDSVAHENRQPYLALNFCIALSGIYPPFY